MKKRALFLIMLVGVLASISLVSSCRKKDDTAPKAIVYPAGASIDGTYYYAQILDSVPSYQSWFKSGSVNTTNANYNAFLYADFSNTYTLPGFPHGFILEQNNLTSTDSITIQIGVYSSQSIVPR